MKCKMKKDDNCSVLLKMKNGCTVKINFQKNDNPNIESIVTENLLYSYEKRMNVRCYQQIV